MFPCAAILLALAVGVTAGWLARGAPARWNLRRAEDAEAEAARLYAENCRLRIMAANLNDELDGARAMRRMTPERMAAMFGNPD